MLVAKVPQERRYIMANVKNVEFNKVDNTLVMEIDLTQDFGLSSTGKTVIVASTGGFNKVDEYSVNLVVLKKVKK
jgi:hypothetical protein